MIAIVQSDADDLRWTRYRREPIRVLTSNQPAFFFCLRQSRCVANNLFAGLTRLLKPVAVHIKPGKRICGPVSGSKQLLTIESVAEIAGAGGMQLAVKNPQRAQEILTAAGVDSQTVPARRSLEDIFIEMVGADR